MRGAVLDIFGGGDVGQQPAPVNDPIVSVREFAFWFWRVKTLRLHGTLVVDVDGGPLDLEIPRSVSSEEELPVSGSCGWEILSPVIFQWWNGPAHVSGEVGEEGYFGGLNFSHDALSTNETGTPTGLTLEISVTDPYFGVIYTHSVQLYKTGGSFSGTLNLEVSTAGDGYFPWEDENGVPLYDPATGVEMFV